MKFKRKVQNLIENIHLGILMVIAIILFAIIWIFKIDIEEDEDYY